MRTMATPKRARPVTRKWRLVVARRGGVGVGVLRARLEAGLEVGDVLNQARPRSATRARAVSRPRPGARRPAPGQARWLTLIRLPAGSAATKGVEGGRPARA